MNFFQSPPVFGHPFNDDRLLRETLERLLPTKYQEGVEKDLQNLGDIVLQEMESLAKEAEAHPPVHVPFDGWGKRIDEIKVSSAWIKLHEIAAKEGIVAIAYERKLKEYSRLHQFAKLYLYHPSSAIYSCPLAMTDGAARLIELFGNQEMKKNAFKFLTSRDPLTFWTSGQWMTERSGGSDVSGTETFAVKEGDQYRLTGDKWFTSATTSEMAMTLAKISGQEKLSLFYVELRDDEGKLQNIKINRLKDKMGTNALPTAELTLEGAPATLVGEAGKGVKTISTLFNITRLYNACCAIGYMRRGLALSIDYSKKRKAFGRTIINHGLHAETQADLQVRFEASFLMTFHAAFLLGKEEIQKASKNESRTLRLLIPLAKLYTAKEGVAVLSEVIESFGGAGYIEDTGLPQLLRNAQVLSIWEGTTNVLSLDALRAIKKEKAGDAFFEDIQNRMNGLRSSELFKVRSKILKDLDKMKRDLKDIQGEEDLNSAARAIAFNLSRIYCASLLAEHADWSLVRTNENRNLVVCKKFMERGLYREFKTGENQREKNLKILR